MVAFYAELLMQFFVYILFSASINQYYIGQTSDISDRLRRHNASSSKSTKKANDWAIVYFEEFATRSEAVLRETEIKKKKSRKYIEKLIQP